MTLFAAAACNLNASVILKSSRRLCIINTLLGVSGNGRSFWLPFIWPATLLVGLSLSLPLSLFLFLWLSRCCKLHIACHLHDGNDLVAVVFESFSFGSSAALAFQVGGLEIDRRCCRCRCRCRCCCCRRRCLKWRPNDAN